MSRARSGLGDRRAHDHRDLKSREWQARARDEVTSALVSWDYPDDIGKLNPPTSKQFKTMITFVLQGMCPEFQTVPFEKAVPPLFQSLGYPTKLSASALKSPTSPHTWPTMLGALHWLCKARTLLENMEESVRVDLDDEKIPADFDGMWKIAYRVSMEEGADAGFTKLRDLMGADSKKQEERIEKHKKETEETKGQIAEVRKSFPSLDELKQGRQKCITSKNEMTQMVTKLERQTLELQKQIKLIEANSGDTTTRTQKLEAKNATLRDKIAKQPFSVEHAQKLKTQLQQLKDTIQKTTRDIEARDRNITTARNHIKEIKQKLEEEVKQYNSNCETLELVPQSARFARGRNFEIRVKSENEIQAILGDCMERNSGGAGWKYATPDMLTNIPTGDALTDRLQSVANDMNQIIRDLRPQISQLTQQKGTLTVKSQNLSREIDLLKKDIASARKNADQYRAQKHEYELKIRELGSDKKKEEREEQLLRQKLQTFDDEVERARLRCDAAERDLNDEIERCEEEVTTHDQKLRTQMKEVYDITMRIADENEKHISKLEQMFTG